jgi:hypothetical protein
VGGAEGLIAAVNNITAKIATLPIPSPARGSLSASQVARTGWFETHDVSPHRE